MNQTNKTKNKIPKGVYVIVGAIFLIGILSQMWGNDKNEKQASGNTKNNEQNAIQIDFMTKKTEHFRELIEGGVPSDEIKKKSTALSKSLLKAENNELQDWEGVIIGVDVFQEQELDLSITIQGRNIVGQKTISGRTMDCSITIEASQGTSKEYGFKGIARSGELYDKVKNLKEGDKVIFSAKVFDIWDNIEASGLNLSTTLHIRLTDIRKK